MKKFLPLLLLLTLCFSCRNIQKTDNGNDETLKTVGQLFNADSAMAYCAAQCDFGPRTMNSEAHEQCGQWIADKFKQLGCTVELQQANLTGWDQTLLHATNIIARYKPEVSERILLCAHWDSRPWADNDPDEANHHQPVLAANDGASGVGVMLEVARCLQDTSLAVGVDFVCFDAEDWGFPQWADSEDPGDTWALGAQYWATHLPEGYAARFGILLDMVGGQGAQFYREAMSQQYAYAVVNRVWQAARQAGYGSFFPDEIGGGVTDDHVPVNEYARIPTIDIIPFYRNCPQSTFGPTWHTVSDDMAHLDKDVLQAVGQTIIQVLFTEE